LAVEVPHLQFFVERAREVAPAWTWVPTPHLAEQLTALQGNGFSVWLDDFGDGVYDESTIGEPGIDLVKLDRSLLEFETPRLTGLVERILARGKVVMIEGVENESHRRLAVDAGIELAQGFLYGWDMSALDFEAYVAAADVRRF
jgi:EAL domain-containing protein (putative c-di-GMP-specific phosphodiesterase class I)